MRETKEQVLARMMRCFICGRPVAHDEVVAVVDGPHRAPGGKCPEKALVHLYHPGVRVRIKDASDIMTVSLAQELMELMTDV